MEGLPYAPNMLPGKLAGEVRFKKKMNIFLLVTLALQRVELQRENEEDRFRIDTKWCCSQLLQKSLAIES